LDNVDISQIREPAGFLSGVLDGDGSEVRRDSRIAGKKSYGESSRKIAGLLDALDEVLLLDSEDTWQYSTEIDKDTLSQCKALRRSLEKQRRHGSSPPTLTTMAPSTSKSNRDARGGENLPHILPPLSLTPWTSSSIPSNLPKLPAIKSPTLETATFTHSGVTSNADILSYERLEWVGDAYLYLISTLLISSTFTTHLPGKCAQIREFLVKNETLASYARHYGFEKRARLPPEFIDNDHRGYRAKQSEKIKVMGDIFEAYVAAVILSDPEQGVDRVSKWLKSLWAQTISKQIIDQEHLNEKTKSREGDGINPNVNSKDLLSRTIGAKGVKISYKDAGPEMKDPTTGFPVFAVAVYLDGWGEHNKQLGIGKALSKKDAGMKAAEMALSNMKLLSSYVEMKRVHDEKLRAEKERAALEAEGSSQTV
jgi:ribonuclease III